MAYKSRKTARSGRCIVRSVDARALSRQSVVSCSVAQECVLVSVKATPTETTNDSQQTHTHDGTLERGRGGVEQTEQVAPPYPFLMGANFSRSNSLFLRNPPRSVSPSTPPCLTTVSFIPDHWGRCDTHHTRCTPKDRQTTFVISLASSMFIMH